MELKDIDNPSIVLTDLTDQNIDGFLPLIINDDSMMIGLSGRKKGMQKITISFDHRVTDGLEVSRFINDTISQLEKQFPSIEMRGSCCMCFKNIEEEELKDSPGFIKVLTSDNIEKLFILYGSFSPSVSTPVDTSTIHGSATDMAFVTFEGVSPPASINLLPLGIFAAISQLKLLPVPPS